MPGRSRECRGCGWSPARGVRGAPARLVGWQAWVARGGDGGQVGGAGLPARLLDVFGWRLGGRGVVPTSLETRPARGLLAGAGRARGLGRIEQGVRLAPAFRGQPGVWHGNRHNLSAKSFPRLGTSRAAPSSRTSAPGKRDRSVSCGLPLVFQSFEWLDEPISLTGSLLRAAPGEWTPEPVCLRKRAICSSPIS